MVQITGLILTAELSYKNAESVGAKN